MSFHPEVLTAPQLEALDAMSAIMSAGHFHLAGGTALAIAMGHRLSVDLDWFTREPFSDPMRFAQELREAGIPLVTERVERGTLHSTVHGVQVSLLEYRYPLLAPPIEWPEHGCSFLSLDDIGCMKLSAISQRGARKDFVDLHALIHHHRPLAELLALYQKKYAVDDIGHVLVALAYFDDAERERMPEMIWKVDWQILKEEIRGWLTEVSSL